MLKVLFKHKVLLIYIPLVIHWISIFILTSLPSKSLPVVSFDDKVKHFIAYLVLSVLLTLSLWALPRFNRLKTGFIKYSFIIAIFYSTFDEIHQIFIPGRYAEIWDWIANLFGIILGIFLIKVIADKNESLDIVESGTGKE